MKLKDKLTINTDQTNNTADIALDRFYSVEFSIKCPKLLYQFKIWNSSSKSMFIIVKEGSDLLMQLKKGDIFKTKYYSTDVLCPRVDLNTQIKDIIKGEDGRFKGHYLVGLDVLSSENKETAH